MQRPLFLFLFLLLVSLLPLSSSQRTKQPQVDALKVIANAWNLTEWNSKVDDPCKDGSKWMNENESFWLNCSKVGNSDWDITGLKVYGRNVSGEIPQELFNLTELTYLNLSHNLLNGSIPGEIANLTNLEKLDLGVNNLSGSISPLSNLTKLTYIGLSGNMLSGVNGSLELKKLTSLEHLYIDSNKFDGSLELKNLKNLKTLWAFDNNFQGPFPASLASLTNLHDLRIYGTSLVGGIPEKFSSQNKLVTLMLGDIGGDKSKLSFLNNMTNLSMLSIRNNNITDDLQNYLPSLKRLKLTYLDLSFNKLTGRITFGKNDFISLHHLFLGNNNLEIEFDRQDMPRNLTMDISFNNIYRNPSHSAMVSINYLGTSTTSDNSSNSDKGISSCLNASSCTTSNFIFLNSSFAVNCGGKEVSISGTDFRDDTVPLGEANFSIDSPNNQWAVSNVGSIGSTSNFHSGMVNVSVPIVGIEGSRMQLYQTARVSTSSLRYYFGGLNNGSYAIDLHFAEIVISDDKTSWECLGRRVFDIFIQDKLVKKDFNIVEEIKKIYGEEAQGSFRAHNESFTADVTNGVLGIHLFWAGKGTFNIQHDYTYGPLLSAINITRGPDNEPPTPNASREGKNITGNKGNARRAGIITGIAAICVAALLIVSSIGYLWWKRIDLGHIRLTDSAMKG